MAVCQIRTYPAPTLVEVARPVENPADVVTLVEDLTDTMKSCNAQGIAANQIADLNRVIVVMGQGNEIIPMINPVLASTTIVTDTAEEGCLSLPGVFGDVERHTYIEVRFTNRSGQEETRNFGGRVARCIQHEIDHLNGIMFVQRLDPAKRRHLNRKHGWHFKEYRP